MTAHGEKVTVRGEDYIVVGVGAASTDPKFWGKRKFTLRLLGTEVIRTTYAKNITANSRLVPVTGSTGSD